MEPFCDYCNDEEIVDGKPCHHCSVPVPFIMNDVGKGSTSKFVHNERFLGGRYEELADGTVIAGPLERTSAYPVKILKNSMYGKIGKQLQEMEK